jgi:magnesium transporter
VHAPPLLPLRLCAATSFECRRYMPELEWRWSYLLFWLLIMSLATFVFNFYRKNRWL